MTKELSALLRKKSWTGEDIGRTILYSLVDAHRQALEGVGNPTPAFSPDQLQRMIGSLTEPSQLRRYNSFVGLQNWLIQYQAVSTAYFKQASGELDVIQGVVNTAMAAEDDLRNLSAFPVILTRKRYEEIKARRVREQLVDEEGKDRTYSVWKLVVLAIAYWYARLVLNPGGENPLKGLQESYQRQPVASRRILDKHGAPPTKWDILSKGNVRQYYPALEDGESASFAEEARDFYGEFPEACKAMLEDMDRALFAGMPALAPLAPEKWDSPACGIRALYTQNIYDMKNLVEGDTAVFAGDGQVKRRGYAIIGPEWEGLLDGKGEAAALQISIRCGIEQYTALNPEMEQAVSRLTEGRKVIEDGYYYVKGYDKAIELIADFLAMPEFLIFQLGAESLAERMRELDEKASELRQRILGSEYGEKAARQAKLEALERYFPPFDWKGLEIPEVAVKEAEGLLSDNMRAFDKQDSAFISILTSREGGA